MDGIFIDETPSSTEFVEYLATLANASKTILNRNVLVPVAQHDLDANQAKADRNNKAPAPAPEPEAKEADKSDTSAPDIVTDASAAAEDDDDTTTQQPLPPPGALTPSASSAVVIYNPGVVVDPIFYRAADYVVAFENAAHHWTAPAVRAGFARLPRPLVARSIVVAHSAAAATTMTMTTAAAAGNGGGGGKGIAVEGVAQACRRAWETGCVGQFITSTDGYTQWCPAWGEFVDEMAKRTFI